MSVVICKMPKAGLGNQMFPLMKAVMLHKLSGLPLHVINYNQFSIGPYLRREKSKRNYTGYFNFQKGYLEQMAEAWHLRKYRNLREVNEPSLVDKSWETNVSYVFSEMPHWEDYFNELKLFRKQVVESFFDLLSPRIIRNVETRQVPCVGVHIRMGDFRKLKEGEDFARVGAVRTPEQYFIDIICGIRSIAGYSVPVTIFTDGFKHELQGLFSLPNVVLEEGNPDIVDLILLSKSKVVVTSAGSTFSCWAGFLSDGALIMHPDHIHRSVRPENMQAQLYEGVFDPSNDVLVENIKVING